MSSEKRSISAPAALFKLADARKEKLNYATFSDYIQDLIRVDTMDISSSNPPVDHAAASASADALADVIVGEATSPQVPSGSPKVKRLRAKAKK